MPSTVTASQVGSALVPRVRTTRPLTVTRPASIIRSARRREATPARARRVWRRTGPSGRRGFSFLMADASVPHSLGLDQLLQGRKLLALHLLGQSLQRRPDVLWPREVR